MLMIVPRTPVIASKRHTHIIQPADRSHIDRNTSITQTSETALACAGRKPEARPAAVPAGIRHGDTSGDQSLAPFLERCRKVVSIERT